MMHIKKGAGKRNSYYLPTALGCDIFLESYNIGKRLDWNQVHSHNKTGYRHKLGSHLQPSSGSSTQVQQGTGFLQELKATIELDQFEGRARTITWVVGS